MISSAVLSTLLTAAQVSWSVGTATAVAGQKVRGMLAVGDEADGTPIALPVAIVSGRRPGPVVWIHALSHGDEYGSARALQAVVRDLDPAAMAGAVVAVLAANPPAFQGLQRVNPNLDDLEDLGTVFPGRERFLTERLAAALYREVTAKADYFIDLHTGGDRFRQLPFVFYTLTGRVPAAVYDSLARGFGIPTLWRDTTRVFGRGPTTLFADAGIPSFLLEVGGGQPLEAEDIRLQAVAVRNFLKIVGVIGEPPPRLGRYTVVQGYRIVTNSRGGFFDALVGPGDRIGGGQELGRIVNVYGDLVETLRAPEGAMIVLGVSTYPAWPTGGWLLELGTGLFEW